MRYLTVLGLWFFIAISAYSQSLPAPVSSIKVRRGYNVSITWTYTPQQEAQITGFQVLWAPSQTSPLALVTTVPRTARQVLLTASYPNGKSMYFVVQATDTNWTGDSYYKNSLYSPVVLAQRIGP